MKCKAVSLALLLGFAMPVHTQTQDDYKHLPALAAAVGGLVLAGIFTALGVSGSDVSNMVQQYAPDVVKKIGLIALSQVLSTAYQKPADAAAHFITNNSNIIIATSDGTKTIIQEHLSKFINDVLCSGTKNLGIAGIKIHRQHR